MCESEVNVATLEYRLLFLCTHKDAFVPTAINVAPRLHVLVLLRSQKKGKGWITMSSIEQEAHLLSRLLRLHYPPRSPRAEQAPHQEAEHCFCCVEI